METELSLFDLGNDEVTGIWTAVILAGELKEIFELFERIFFAGARARNKLVESLDELLEHLLAKFELDKHIKNFSS